jgi:hypothetical protein
VLLANATNDQRTKNTICTEPLLWLIAQGGFDMAWWGNGGPSVRTTAKYHEYWCGEKWGLGRHQSFGDLSVRLVRKVADHEGPPQDRRIHIEYPGRLE